MLMDVLFGSVAQSTSHELRLHRDWVGVVDAGVALAVQALVFASAMGDFPL